MNGLQVVWAYIKAAAYILYGAFYMLGAYIYCSVRVLLSPLLDKERS